MRRGGRYKHRRGVDRDAPDVSLRPVTSSFAQKTAVVQVLAWALLGAVGGCRKSTPDAPPPARAPLSEVEVLKDGRWLFTYVDPSGEFMTTDKPEIIPEAARRIVRVVDPARPPGERLDTGDVYLLDANQLLKAGKAAARALPRLVFETAALAQLPPGESSLLADRAHAGTPKAPSATADPSPPLAPMADGGAPVVTVYGTSWCGACKTARQYLAQRKIPFADKDVEKDPAAARELAEKAARMGVPADRVPILDVRGRLLVGFDRARVEALLGAAT